MHKIISIIISVALISATFINLPINAYEAPHIMGLRGLPFVGTNVQLNPASFIGRKSVLMFWKYDCPPCRVEALQFSKIRASFGNLPIIMVVPEYGKREQIALKPVLSAGAMILKASDLTQLLEYYGDEEGGVPYSVMFDKNGYACISNLGPIDAKVAKDMISECN